MHSNIYVVHDKVAASIIGGAHLHKHDAAAVRFFADIASIQDSQIARHPHDFALYRVGSIDLETGVLTAETPEVVIDGASWIAAQRREENS